jgi:Pentapeptide repeats (8 copies).
MKVEIKSRWSGNILFSIEAASMRFALEAGVKQGANLKGANLEGAYLKGANLVPIRDDFWAVLSSAPAEVMGLRKALIEGRVDGSTYTGECACLVGTIANVKGSSYDDLPVLKPNAQRPAERFFLNIKKGDTPETNSVSKTVLEWLDQWVENIKGFAA